MELDEIRQDIAAFADSDQGVLIHKETVVFQRDGNAYECKLRERAGAVEVDYRGNQIPYIKFLSEELGRLPILAQAIKEKRKDVEFYIDTKANVTDDVGKSTTHQSAASLLYSECESKPVGETKLVFLTADAGEGKTAVLRHLTRRIADRYLAHQTGMLLLHVDTQGRSFVRLEELVARDLGQLRISGLFYSGVIRLIRRGLLAIAIDGFDELLAEVGSAEAYSGLGAFLHQLGGKGVVIAAARSAYFEAENYAAQSRLLSSLPDTLVSVHQVTLLKWGEQETVGYFKTYRGEGGQAISRPLDLYAELASRLGATHPVLQRPFLVQRLAAILSTTSMDLDSISNEVGPSGLKVVPNVIQAFLRREVDEKWRDRNGQPYLTLGQHMHLLAAVADEMWIQGKNSLGIEIVQLVCETILDEIKIAPDRRVQVIERVKAHALLPPSELSPRELTFDHEEFLNYFLAVRLAELLKDGNAFGLQRFCERHTLPAIVGAWTMVITDLSPEGAASILERLNLMTRTEVRSTYLKQNAGLLAAKMTPLVASHPPSSLTLDSMYFEGEEWKDSGVERVEFQKCTFINIDLRGATFKDCRFVECQIDGLAFDTKTRLPGTIFDLASQVIGVFQFQEDGSSLLRNYVPEHCIAILQGLGADFVAPERPKKRAVKAIPDDKRQALEAFFRIFSRNSGATEQVMHLKLGTRLPLFQRALQPLLLRHNVIRFTEYRGQGQQHRFELNYPLDLILKAEDPDSTSPQEVKKFWEELRK